MYDGLQSPGRNDECWCGSGKKYKKCHLDFDERLEELAEAGEEVPPRDLLKTPAEIEGIKRSAEVSIGVLDYAGTTGLFDHSALILFDALLMTAGLCTMERKNLKCAAAMGALLTVNFALLAAYLFGGSYQQNANVYFAGFQQLSARAAQIQRETGAKINVTSNIYPHIQPDAGAEMMFLYASDADMRAAETERGERYEAAYMPEDMQLEPEQIYLAKTEETSNWDFDGFAYEESEGYSLLYPL